ncbi:Double-strand-break repair protein rad21 [Cichlidogyrus casuarinus]|uniref:Double-strand-break repair protein rad21 n=1 Tax=Cichlidogyrus casuarinus TaxID=1844966 RepID=A0ABD2QEH6_9PLAT
MSAVGDNVRPVMYQAPEANPLPSAHSDNESDFGGLNDDFEAPGAPHQAYEEDQVGQTPAYNLQSVSQLENLTDDVLALERELAACDQEAEAEKLAALNSASELSANAAIVAGSAIESAEEKRLERRSKVMLRLLRSRFAAGESVAFSFQSLCTPRVSTKKQVASKFYTMLLLRKQGVVELNQGEPFSDIIISRGQNFSNVEVH